MPPKLTIIIVNYKTPRLLLDCVASIYQFSVQDLDIIVVDNDSRDNTEQQVKSAYPQVKFMQMGYNAGFARANNAAIRVANSEAILLLNSDTIIENDAINKCLQSFMPGEEVACGVQLLNPDRSPQISGNFAMRGGLNYLLPLPYLGSFFKWIAGLMLMKKPNVPEASGKVSVDWINGAFLMVKKSACEKAGLMDEDFFLYAEEAEWCSRLKKQGPLCIYGQYKVLHLQGESANEAFASEGKGYFNLFDRKGLQIMVSNFVRIRKQFGVLWFLFDLWIYIVAVPVFGIGLLLSTLFTAGKTQLKLHHWKGYTKNIWKLISLTPTIIANKPYFYKVL